MQKVQELVLVHLVDVETDLETGHTKICVIQFFKTLVKQFIQVMLKDKCRVDQFRSGWALNEEYIYNNEGKLQNPGF